MLNSSVEIESSDKLTEFNRQGEALRNMCSIQVTIMQLVVFRSTIKIRLEAKIIIILLLLISRPKPYWVKSFPWQLVSYKAIKWICWFSRLVDIKWHCRLQNYSLLSYFVYPVTVSRLWSHCKRARSVESSTVSKVVLIDFTLRLGCRAYAWPANDMGHAILYSTQARARTPICVRFNHELTWGHRLVKRGSVQRVNSITWRKRRWQHAISCVHQSLQPIIQITVANIYTVCREGGLTTLSAVGGCNCQQQRHSL